MSQCPQALWDSSRPHQSSNPAFFEDVVRQHHVRIFFPQYESLNFWKFCLFVFFFPKPAASVFNSFLSFAGLPVLKFMSLIEVSGPDLSVIHLMSSHSLAKSTGFCLCHLLVLPSRIPGLFTPSGLSCLCAHQGLPEPRSGAQGLSLLW